VLASEGFVQVIGDAAGENILAEARHGMRLRAPLLTVFPVPVTSGHLFWEGVAPPKCHTMFGTCMTMLSFRVADEDAERVQVWAERLGVDRSEVLREALHQHLLKLASEDDAVKWVEQPLDVGERSLEAFATWGPAEDWSEWCDAAG